MFRNSYDNDPITYAPTGRLFQVEYALEAIKQGSAAVGLVNSKYAVLVALKRNTEDLGSYQKKILRIDDHMGIAIAGLTPDARVLSSFLRQQAMASKMRYGRPLPVIKAANALADKAQGKTQYYGRRPYGLGLLIIGVDQTGPHLFEFQPSGNSLEYLAAAIGARSQAARTYFERTNSEFADASVEELVIHGLTGLRETLPQDKELNISNTSIAIVGIDKDFELLDNEAVAPWLERLGDTRRTRAPADEPADEPPEGPADGPADEPAAEATESMDTS
ncbi:hypothetical protein CANCADRAFT_43836 [Tortispora caseinolytica NRRL Y-17796]|uniref:Proteasome alpha-type subunits domain-containing protein n=1 Tax=Tortispora caseinolytica NRRL Y-17796 TaxID=767744 RepID=A0A1E4TEM6_9ASCO|nr:hypothetical protein CANCADRAFT_43836 [Tortispora caseinolytica NRRL Y-17796]